MAGLLAESLVRVRAAIEQDKGERQLQEQQGEAGDHELGICRSRHSGG